jgi:hypothetical protein
MAEILIRLVCFFVCRSEIHSLLETHTTTSPPQGAAKRDGEAEISRDYVEVEKQLLRSQRGKA